MKIKNLEIKPEKLLPLASAVLGIAGMFVSNAIQANEKKALKAELKDEILKDLGPKEN
jgi:hypothetical protein